MLTGTSEQHQGSKQLAFHDKAGSKTLNTTRQTSVSSKCWHAGKDFGVSWLRRTSHMLWHVFAGAVLGTGEPGSCPGCQHSGGCHEQLKRKNHLLHEAVFYDVSWQWELAYWRSPWLQADSVVEKVPCTDGLTPPLKSVGSRDIWLNGIMLTQTLYLTKALTEFINYQECKYKKRLLGVCSSSYCYYNIFSI